MRLMQDVDIEVRERMMFHVFKKVSVEYFSESDIVQIRRGKGGQEEIIAIFSLQTLQSIVKAGESI
jgi:hypothetical protein